MKHNTILGLLDAKVSPKQQAGRGTWDAGLDLRSAGVAHLEVALVLPRASSSCGQANG